MPEEGESEKLSIALELSQRGGEEAYVELVLPVPGERGAAFARLLVLRSGRCWETGPLLFYLGCGVPQGSRRPRFTSARIPPLPVSASPYTMSGAGGSCPAPLQFTDTGKPTKAVGFFLSFLQGNQLI